MGIACEISWIDYQIGKACRGFPCLKTRAARMVANWGIENFGLVKAGPLYTVDVYGVC